MKRYTSLFLLIPLLCSSAYTSDQAGPDLFVENEKVAAQSNQDEYDKVSKSTDWKLRFSDACTGNWQDHWFLDGEIATVENTDNGMNFSAGPKNRDDAHHAVLWTKKSFEGDVKIEYNYTRTDQQIINVNILYIQASGIGKGPYDRDISKWNELRKVPKMSVYFNYMDPLHISYAAFRTDNENQVEDYIRVRQYPATEERPFRDTEILPAYFRTGLFLPGRTYKITVIKTGEKLFFHVAGKDEEELYEWDLKGKHPIEGRIGLRHMYTRSAMYSDFKVYVK